ncbi:hypothetical protein ACQPYE_19630 [Actinosynnema sp. CA-299493]
MIDELLRRQGELQARADAVVGVAARHDVYRSVLDDGVRTPEDYDRWRVTHGQ